MSGRSLQRVLIMAFLPVAGMTAPSPVVGQSGADGVPVVSLAEARRRAVSVGPEAVAARLEVETAVWERRTALMDLITPNVTADASYTHFSDPFFNFGTGAISPSATSATLQASYTLLGTKIAELKRSRASLESAEANAKAARFRTAVAADAAYFAVLAAHESARVAADRLRRAEEQLGVARARVRAGAAIAPDSLQLLLEVNRARLARLRSDSALAVSRLRLGSLIGLSGPAEAVPIDMSAPPPPLPFTAEEAVREMRSRGPELEAARAIERRAEARLTAERAGYLPAVTLGATTGAYDAEFFPSALRRTQLAITVSLPIWNGGVRELAVARARAQRDVATAEREERERAAAELMAEAHHGYRMARAGTGLARVGVAAAAETYRVQRARYREGATTILELLEAQLALTEAEATLVRARYAARLALARIEALLGRRIFETPETDPNRR